MPSGSIVLSFTSDGKDFTHTTRFNPPITIPDETYNEKVALVGATIWNSVPNIDAPKNIISYQYKNLVTGANDVVTWNGTWTTVTLVIPPGLYSVEQLNEALERLQRDQELDHNLLFIEGDLPTDRIVFCSNSTTYREEIRILNPPTTPRSVIGFPEDDNFRLEVGYENKEIAPLQAKFNQMNWFVLRNSLASPGLSEDGRTRSILGRVYLDESPNSLLTYEPAYPIFVTAKDLRWVNKISEVQGAWYQDDGVTPALTNNPWQYTVEIRYDY